MTVSKARILILMMAAATCGLAAAPPVRADSSFTITVTAVYPSWLTAPAPGATTSRTPTIYGDAMQPNVAVTITGRSGGSTIVVATTTSDASGKFMVKVDPSTPLDTGSNSIVPRIGSNVGVGSDVTVVANPGTTLVPAIDPQFADRRFAMARPTVTGQAASGSACALYSKSLDGTITQIGTCTTASGGAFSVLPATDFTAGKCEVFVVASGAASEVLDMWFVDPYGVVYDSQTNGPIEGATVTLQRSTNGGTTWNNAVPGVDIGATDQNPQTTDVSGSYGFMTVPGDFRLQVTRQGYTFPSARIAAGQPAAGSHGELFTVSTQVLNIGLPADFAGEGLLKVAKTANKTNATIGDIVTYTVTIQNEGSQDLTNVYLKDLIPAGFKYMTGKVRLDGSATDEPSGTRPLVFNIGTVAAGQTRILKYQLVIGSGVTLGNYDNVAVAIFSNGRAISNTASASVTVVVDPTFDLGTIIGKVFVDKNANGLQDEGEKTVSSVRIIMEDGTTVMTDVDGKFHIPGVMSGRHVLVVDERTLPKGATLTTRKAVLVDLTDGMMAKANFGVRFDEATAEAAMTHRPLVITPDSKRPVPQLNVAFYDMAQGRDKYDAAHRYVFRIFTNYAAFIDTWSISVIDQETRAPLRTFSGDANDIYSPIYWDGTLKDGARVDQNRKYAYQLTVRSKAAAEDTTKERPLELKTYEEDLSEVKDRILRDERANSKISSVGEWLSGESGGNNIEKQSINIDGEMLHMQARETGNAIVRVRDGSGHSIDIPANRAQSIESTRLATAGGLLPTSAADVSTDVILPRGEYDVDIVPLEPKGSEQAILQSSSIGVADANAAGASGPSSALYTEHVKVCEDYMTLVAMGDAKVGYAFATGNLEPVNNTNGYKTGLWQEGKIAYYLKGRVKGKYLVTSSLDSDRDTKELFRKIEPEKYYPVYGDNSSVNYDATNTLGKLYLLVEWDKSSAMWGSYNTEFKDTDLAQFDRSLYGGKVNYQSVEGTKFGEPVTKVTAFSSQAQQKAAHNEFVGTGGSLYYLKDRNVIQGSDKVSIQVRDKITGLTLASRSMSSGSDYQINYDQGRILFWRPVNQTAESDVIISTALLAGNQVYVVVDYEYDTAESLSQDTAGITAQQALSDYLSIGGTYVKEQQLEKDYQLKATNAKVHLSDTAVLKAEYAESEARGTGNWVSTDGGLTFNEMPAGANDQGKAYSVTAEDHIGGKLGVKGYFQRVEKGFSSTGTASQQGKETRGAEAAYDLNDKTRVKVSRDEQELLSNGNPQSRAQLGAQETATTIAQITRTEEDIRLTGEYRRQEVSGKIDPFTTETNQKGDTAAARVDYMADKQTELSLEQQVTLNGTANNQTTGGVVTRVSDNLDVRAKQVVGNQGSATSVGAVARNKDKYELYSDYTLADYGLGNAVSMGGRMKQGKDTDSYAAVTTGSNGKSSSVVGTHTRGEKGLDVTQERAVTTVDGETANTDIVGVNGNINSKWRALTQMEARGEVQKLDGSTVERTAYSVGLGYSDVDKSTGRQTLKTLTKLELRSDHGDQDQRQYVLYNMIEGRPDSATTLSAMLELSNTKDIDTDRTIASYAELVLGIAYRPVEFDNLNLLGKYTYLADQAPEGQRGTSDTYDQKSHTVSGEMIYDLTNKWQLISKAAFKVGYEKVDGFDWTNAQKLLLAQRISYLFEKDWRIGLEYRRLTVLQAKDSRQGVLVELSRRIGDYLDLGIGYNFTDFNDDLTRLNYSSQGPYIRLTAIFYN